MIFLLQAKCQRGGFVGRNAEPVHAGVHMDRRAAAPVLRRDEGIPLRQLRRAVDDRLRVELGESVGRLRRKSVEHVDRRFAGAGPCTPRFGDVGDEESLAAGLRELGRHRLKAEAVGVGLDDRRAFDGEKLMRQRPPIRLDGIKIDGERAAGLGVGERSGRFGQWFCECHAAL